jgi:hypothetical protein
MTAIATTDGHSGDADGQQAQMVVGEARKQADFQTCAGMLSQPRTADEDEKTAFARSTSQSGKRVNTSSSAMRPSMRASVPKQ